MAIPMARNTFKYVLDRDRIYQIYIQDNVVVEVSGHDLINTYLTSQGYI
jgi:hypothetical protein